MGQRVDYESLPGTRYDQYIFKLRNILRFLGTEEAKSFKPLRDFLRKQGVWDREKSIRMFDLIDLTWDKKTVKIGKLARQLMEAGSDEQVKDLLYKRLESENILLVKYVFEALDVEAGGRLHSVHELYRMITSYVFPGEYITLPNFQAWMEWMAATGYLKLVGIRWALGERGLEVLPELKGMDVEEILEDLEDEEDGEDDEEEDDEVAPAPTPAAAPAPAPAPAAADEPEQEEWEDLGMPPEPEPPSEAEIAAAQARFAETFGDQEAEAAAAAPAATRGAIPAAAPAMAATLHAPFARASVDHFPAIVGPVSDPHQIAERLVSWWEVLSDWPAFTAPDLGTEAASPEQGRALLLELAVLAILVEGQRPGPQLFAFVTRLREGGFFETLGDISRFLSSLDALAELSEMPGMRPLFERLIHTPTLARRAGMAPDLIDRVASASDGAAAVRLIRDELVGEGWVEAPFWILRELYRLKLVERPELLSGTVVPTERLLANAARVGLIPTPRVASFDGLIAVSAAVSRLFGPDAGYGEALELMDRALSLASD